MPELPEVEVTRKGLSDLLVAQPKILKFEFQRDDLRFPIPKKELQKLVGQKILQVHRRAKYLLFETENGGFLSHLGMTGTWRNAPVGDEREHDHIYILLSNGVRLAYRDPRRFGIFELWNAKTGNALRLSHLGPEPLSKDFSIEWFVQMAKKKSLPVKTFLMDQKVVVGVGNIYASEALFLAGIRPLRSVRRLKSAEIAVLLSVIRKLLARAIRQGGSSVSDYYSFTGTKGNFQLQHNVYDRRGLACRKCNNLIRAEVLSGRSTFWCPVCQK